MSTWAILVSSGFLVAIGRMVVIAEYWRTGEKLLPEPVVVAGFWLQFLLIGFGVALRQMQETRPNGEGRHDC